MDLKKVRIAAVVNSASGSCTPKTANELVALLETQGITAVHVWSGDSSTLLDGFQESAAYDPDVLIVLGGDGTIRTAAELASAGGPALIPLPGGTMNVFPKALYGDSDWKTVLLRLIKESTEKRISGGEVSGHRFFISAICGAPILFTHVREALREGEFAAALKHGEVALGRMFSSKIHYRFNEMHEGTTEALSVCCPLISSALAEDRNVFEAAVIDVNHAGDVLGLVTAAAFGNWRDDRNVAIVRTKRVSVSAEGSIPLILDGEAIDVGSEADITFVPDAFTVIVPN